LNSAIAREFDLLPIVDRLASPDGTVKYVWKLADENTVESVFLPFEYFDSFCISSQAGCHLRCGFCATGLGGLIRNLDPKEIVAQVSSGLEDLGHPEQSRAINVSFMGMGEPLLNLDAVLASVEQMRAELGEFQFTVSTVGIVPKIEELAERDPRVFLQLSLHAPNDELRTKLLPINSKYNIAQILAAGQAHAKKVERYFVVNYVLFGGVNDSDECANQLVALLKGFDCYLKISRYNPVEGFDLVPSSEERSAEFAALCEKGGLNVLEFQSKGVGVAAGCGQLRATRGNDDLVKIRRASTRTPRI
jgi:23S rRNA (adenine2503-C2)-methyltransferase